MNRLRIVFFFLSFFLILSCTNDFTESNNNSNNESYMVELETMVSTNFDSIAMVALQSDNSTRNLDSTFFLSAIKERNYVPLLFLTNNLDLVSVLVSEAKSFDHYVLCNVQFIVHYDDEISTDTIQEYVHDATLKCTYSTEPFYKTILIDFLSGEIIDLTFELRNIIPDTICFNDEYIFLTAANERILRISKFDLNEAKYISSDLDKVYCKMVLGDYVISKSESYPHDLKAFLIDDSDVPVKCSNFKYYLDNYLIPQNKNAGYVYTFSYSGFFQDGFGETYNEYILKKISVKKGSIGEILGTQKLKFKSKVRMFNLNLNNTLNTYSQSNSLDTREHYPAFANSHFDLMGNAGVDILGNSIFYFVEDDSEFGCNVIRKEMDCNFIANLNDDNILLQENENVYFVTDYSTIGHFNFYTGEYEESTYNVDIYSLKREYITISGYNVIYKELITGSTYATKVINLKDLNEKPLIVDYQTSDVIYLPGLFL